MSESFIAGEDVCAGLDESKMNYFSNPRSTTFLSTEPRGLLYQQLIQLARKECATFSLVRRLDNIWGEEAEKVAGELLPFLNSEQMSKRWPGTRCSKAHQVWKFALTRESASILEKAKGLFDWNQPRFPEDLAFYTPDGVVWMCSCSHEGLAEWGNADIAAKVRLKLPEL